jgi:hypothetical protein
MKKTITLIFLIFFCLNLAAFSLSSIPIEKGNKMPNFKYPISHSFLETHQSSHIPKLGITQYVKNLQIPNDRMYKNSDEYFEATLSKKSLRSNPTNGKVSDK